MLQHVTREISQDQLDPCLLFYGMIGFEQRQPPAGIAGRAFWLERAGTQIHLMLKDQPTPPSGHVGIVVEAYEETLARLRERGHEIEPRREHWGSPRCYVRDPAGNLVELMAWPPGGSA